MPQSRIFDRQQRRVSEVKLRRCHSGIEQSTLHLRLGQGSILLEAEELHGQSSKLNHKGVVLLLFVQRDDVGVIFGEAAVEQIPFCVVKETTTMTIDLNILSA
jgi:hypothetical protein